MSGGLRNYWRQSKILHVNICFKANNCILVTVDEKPWFAVEAKTQDEEVSPTLRSFQESLKIPFVYQALKKKGVDKSVRGVRGISADKLLMALV